MDPHKDTIKINDLTGVAPWLEAHGVEVDMERDPSGKVVGYAPATPEVYRLMAAFQSGPQVDLNEFLRHQRRLRGRMLDLRDNNGKRANGHERYAY